MTTTDERFQRLLDDARRDPEVIGVVLSGSRGKGFGTPNSDYDLYVVVQEEISEECWLRLDGYNKDGIELGVWPLSMFEACSAWGTEHAWNRYAFANVAVPVDKTGRIQQLVDEKEFVPDEHRLALIKESLGAYTNSLYRSLKCLQRGDRLGARLEAADAVGSALTAVFALEGRHRPFNGYLERELRHYPLQSFPLNPDELLAIITRILDDANAETQQRLLAVVEPLGRAAGCDYEFDEWGERFDWMKRYRPAGTPE
ncbi:MAG TPA: DUF4037 domain-containing protein [Thermomicrobiales bacterium]|nr:DUF4037 domain-containing protein [Thermomicrobiales bacterium]